MKIFVTIILVCCLTIFSRNNAAAQGGAQLDLTWPVWNSVTQRNASNQATITIAGQLWVLTGGSLPSTLTYTIRSVSATGAVGAVVGSDVVALDATGLFYRQVVLSKGWYNIDIEGQMPGAPDPTSFWSSRFGVGDVFVIAGQSNAKGVGATTWDVPVTSSFPEWIVSVNEDNQCLMNYPPNMYFSFSKLQEGNRISPTGDNSWCWAAFGKRHSDANGGMPVAFFNAAYSGSGIRNWYESANGLATNDLYTSPPAQYCANFTGISPNPSYFIGQPFQTLKNALNYYASMFGVRAVLWHQGEADTDRPTPGGIKDVATYQSYLTDVISKSRLAFNGSLSWMISQVSYTAGATTANILTAQNNVATSNFLGGNTDVQQSAVIQPPQTFPLPTSSFRGSDNVHFRDNTAQGLQVLANEWREQIDKTTTTAFNRIAAGAVPSVTVTKSGSSRTITASPGGSEYRWGTNINSATSTGTTNSITLTPASHTVLRCFKRVGNNWTASARIAIGSSYCTSCREGVVDENTLEDTEMGIGFKMFPNPIEKDFTIEFDVPEASLVKIDIVDNQGRILKTIANASHAKGHYVYPTIKVAHSPTTILFCRLTIGQTAYTKKLLIAPNKQ
ncbi:sialate O-acetylesterase [Dyadobacter sp. 676]|uniref:Sialate O-acetylesterase n=1 Tax=Dyadobacter sp. 676 TaxID=3088362 RepID=A0AAU8FSX0_9BACT